MKNKTRIWIDYIFFAVFLFSGTIFLIENFHKIPDVYWNGALLFCILFFVYFLWFLYRHFDLLRQGYENKETLLSALYTVIPQMEIIYGFFLHFEDLQKKGMDFGGELSSKYVKIKENMSKIHYSISEISKYRKEIKKKKLIDSDLSKKLNIELKSVNNQLYNISIGVTSNLEEYRNSLEDQIELRKKFYFNMSTLIFYMESAVPIISDFSEESNKFSSAVLLEVIEEFKKVGNFSDQITGNVKKTMNSFMDESQEDSLAFMIKKESEIQERFKSFYANMQDLKNTSSFFIEQTVENLQGINKMANSIQGIAKTIRTLSLNVSIEAANTGQNGAGFHVLARELRTFANSTMKFAQEVQNSIKETIFSTQSLEDKFSTNLGSVDEYLQSISGSLDSFHHGIGASFSKIQSIVSSLSDFSQNMNKDLKQIISKLQYYDVTKQEIENVSKFINHIFEIFTRFKSDTDVESDLTEESKKEIQKNILTYINGIITTGNEREILEKYEKIFNIQVSEKQEIENKAHSISELKDEQENIILF